MPTPLWRLYEFVRISGGATRWFICRAASAADREAAAPDDTAGGQVQAAMIACRQLVRINVQQQPRVGRGIRGQMPETLAAEAHPDPSSDEGRVGQEWVSKVRRRETP